MKVTFLDFESLYSKDYSLRKMTPAEYILDPRFETIGLAVKEQGAKSYWLDRDDVPRYFKQADPKGGYAAHNMLFDGCIMAWRYNFVPRLLIDTLGIARSVLGHELKSLSLASVMLHLGIGKKGDALPKVMGMNLEMINAAGLYDEFVRYGLNDVDGCEGIWDKLVRTGKFPISELAVADMILRCAIQPAFLLDQTALAEHYNDVIVDKANLIAQSGLQYDEHGKCPELMSNDKFAVLLRNLGVEPPTKTSLVTQKVTWAFAKTDAEFIELEEHPDPRVQALVAARMGHKSTIEETRTQRLISIANLDWPGQGQARLMPVPLRFSGAHTHRFSGDWKLNMQNLPTRKGVAKIRQALVVAPGHTVLTVDAAQIQARMVAWFCGQEDLIEAYEKGEDVYASFASDVFGFPVNKKDHPSERFCGKTGVLGLGFQAGWPKFQATVKTQSKAQTGNEIILNDEDASMVVNTYRRKYSKIPDMWKLLGYTAIDVMAGEREPLGIGPMHFGNGHCGLPGRLQLKYHDLRKDEDGWTYSYGGKRKKLYGGALLENIVQYLERMHVADAAVRIQRRVAPLNVRLNLQGHDELVFVVAEEHLAAVRDIALEEMARRPDWAPDLPLAAEAGSGQSYGHAK